MGLFKVTSNEKNSNVKGVNHENNIGTDKELKGIKSKDIIKTFNVSNSVVKVEIKGAKVGKIDNKEVVLDEVMLDERIKQVLGTLSKTVTKYNPMPTSIVINNDVVNESNSEIENDKDNIINDQCDLLSVYEPKWSLDDVYMEESDKEAIHTSLTMAKYKDVLFNEWGIKGNKDNGRAVCLNFWGLPGTGKSMAAEAIAKYLDKNLLIVNYSELESKFVGETPKNIKRVFNNAREKDAVIVFDEADSFLGKRLTNVTQSADYGVNITRSVMLIELENFDGVVIFTTNLLTNYDDAFKRRILANIEFKLPNEEGRQAIWKAHIPSSMPISSDVTFEKLAKSFDGISGADIKDIVLFAATKCLKDERRLVEFKDFEYSYGIVKSRYNNDNVEIKSEKISEEQYKKEIDESRKNS